MKRKEVIALFREAGIEDAEHDAFALFRANGFSDAQIFAEDPDLSDGDFLSAVRKRASHVPLAYVLGYADFYRETYAVDENCLIPRMDTEILVDYVVSHLPAGACFADLCTGSGCIAISVLLHTEKTTAFAADISEGALLKAAENAEKYGVQKRLTLSFSDVLRKPLCQTFDAIVSNPPYVKDGVYETLSEEVKKEPKQAFVGGVDGMNFYRAILKNNADLLKPCGFFAFEIGFDQKEDIKNLAKENGYFAEVINDLGGNARVAVLRKQN